MGLNKYPCLPHVSIAIHSGPKTPPRSWKNWRYDTTILNWTLSILPLCGWFIYTWYHDIIHTYIYIHIHIYIYKYIYCNIFVLSPYGWPGATMRLTDSPCASTKLSRLPFPAWTAISKTISGHSQPLIQCSAGPASHFGWTRNMSVCRPVEEINIDQLL